MDARPRQTRARGLLAQAHPRFGRSARDPALAMTFGVAFAMTFAVAIANAISMPGAVQADETDLAPSGPSGPSGQPGQPGKPGVLTLDLRDGARIHGRIALAALPVETAYGLLVVPVADLVEVRLAQRVPLEMARQIEDAARRLGDDDFEVREGAMAELIAIGRKAAPQVRALMGHEDDEVRSRAQEVLASLEAEPPPVAPAEEEEDLALRGARGRDDEVVTTRFAFRGRVRLDALAVETPYGALDVALSQVAAASFGAGGPVRRVETVPATTMVPGSWVATGITLRRGARVKIVASGELNVPNYNLTAGPEGTTRYSGTTFGGFPMLSLVGKVGASGKPFLVGREYRGKAPRDGRLYLGVVPFRRNYAATGSFKAEVEAE